MVSVLRGACFYGSLSEREKSPRWGHMNEKSLSCAPRGGKRVVPRHPYCCTPHSLGLLS
jgi:hypothetical protein